MVIIICLLNLCKNVMIIYQNLEELVIIIFCLLNLCRNVMIIFQDLEELNCKRSKWELERAGQVTKFFSDESFVFVFICVF